VIRWRDTQDWCIVTVGRITRRHTVLGKKNVRTNLRLYECTYESTLIRMYVRIYAYTNVRTNLRLYECTNLPEVCIPRFVWTRTRTCGLFQDQDQDQDPKFASRSLHPEVCIPKFASRSLHPEVCVPILLCLFPPRVGGQIGFCAGGRTDRFCSADTSFEGPGPLGTNTTHYDY